MPTRKLAAMLAALAVLASSVAFADLYFEHIPSDDDMYAMLTGEAVIAEGRINDSSGVSQHKLDLGGLPDWRLQTVPFLWPNGSPVPFELTFSSTSNRVTFTVGDQTLTYGPSSGFRDIFIRTTVGQELSTALVDQLVLDGESIDEVSCADDANGGEDILHIGGAALMDGFALFGVSTMTWDPSPRRSNLSYQIRFGTVGGPPPGAVPEPSSMALFVAGAAGLLYYRRRRGKASA
jgi:hypothetical protein